ncbi:MAG TPA: DEAD/DEAH box helicase [Spirochaetota bacterium]|nr:DEAD/DEAH box helicase [Spirochaetota bacterium]HOS33686.1 DEAD/DEAH box helicase [Spirochaetota bacterium]HOS54842.1 DEAD/DEAH box helicase [Spirochaetota bacterium]HPK61958.1 DEAD/DEAH box helicase [Spirochaetota bacterium]HQF76797.1 DEAD/DEAH box helicase [Spirochaetota bacterium]
MENGFNKFNIENDLINLLEERRIYSPTEIQEEVIPKILRNQNVIGQAKTGTGKTIAYVVPIIDLLRRKKENVLIIAPTKELAAQIFKEVQYFSSGSDIDSILLISGENINTAKEKLKRDYNIYIGVPGRIIKLVDVGALKLSSMKRMVLDEIDFLIDLGFKKDLERIFELSKNVYQTMAFSATLSRETKKILDIANKQNITSRVHPKNKLPVNIKNYFFPIDSEANRSEVLLNILENINPYLCIIFCRTKKESDWLYSLLKEKKYLTAVLNGGLTPAQRKRELDSFRKAKVQYLVSTDLAGRGLDIEGINYIINYNLPLNELDYLHRAGRTGRVEEEGIAYSICNELDEGYLKKYSYELDFIPLPLKIEKNKIVEYKNYKGVKPRFNLKDKEKIKKIIEIKKNIKAKKEENDAKKARRYRKKR